MRAQIVPDSKSESHQKLALRKRNPTFFITIALNYYSPDSCRQTIFSKSIAPFDQYHSISLIQQFIKIDCVRCRGPLRQSVKVQMIQFKSSLILIYQGE